MTANSNSTSGGIRVTSQNKLSRVNASSDAFIYYTNLSKDWATKTNGTVDGEEYSAKYYAQLAYQSAQDASDSYDDTVDYVNELKSDFRQGIGLIKNDENNAIKGSADGIYVDLSDLETDISSIESDIGVLSNLTTDTKASLVAAINEHETAINQKIDINSAVVDGQWCGVSQQILEQTNCPVGTGLQTLGTYDLSSYLPDDNYAYEVQMSISFRTKTNASYASVTVNGSGMQILHGMAYCMLNSLDVIQTTGIGIVGANKTITVAYNSTNGAQIDYLTLIAYRRIGTNA